MSANPSLSFSIPVGLKQWEDCFPLPSNQLISAFWYHFLPFITAPELLSQMSWWDQIKTEIKLRPIVSARGSVTNMNGEPHWRDNMKFKVAILARKKTTQLGRWFLFTLITLQICNVFLWLMQHRHFSWKLADKIDIFACIYNFQKSIYL